MLAAWAFIAVGACNGPAEVDPTLVAAVQVESKSDRVREELEAKEREEAAARRKALEARERELASAARLSEQLPPAEFPDDLGAACDAVTEAYDAFMKAGSENDVLRWHDGRRKKLGERRVGCIKQGSIEVAACQAQALRADFKTLGSLARPEAAHLVLAACAERMASAKGSSAPDGA